MKDDHRSYTRKKKRKPEKKKIQACTGFEPFTSAIPVQLSAN